MTNIFAFKPPPQKPPPSEATSALGGLQVRWNRGKPFEPVFQSHQTGQNKLSQFLETKPVMLPPRWYLDQECRLLCLRPMPSWELDSHPGYGENATELSYWDSTFFPWLCSPGCCKLLIRIQSSKKVDFGTFCSFIAFGGWKDLGVPYSTIFAGITLESTYFTLKYPSLKIILSH